MYQSGEMSRLERSGQWEELYVVVDLNALKGLWALIQKVGLVHSGDWNDLVL